jgi:hypothetical protein
VVDHLLSIFEALSLIPSTTEKKEKKKERKQEKEKELEPHFSQQE